MTITATANLSLPLITTGTESGTWGDYVDNGLTAYLDIAIAGRLAIAITSADISLSNTAGTNSATGIVSTGATGSSAQYVILNITGTKTGNRTLTLPVTNSASAAINGKWYIVNNAGDGAYTLTVKASGQTGVTFANGEKAIIAYNGTDFVKIANLGGIGSFTGIGVGTSLTPSTWSTGNAVEVGGAGSALYGASSTSSSLTSNAYYNSTWNYAVNGLAARYDMLSGTHTWYVAPTGIVGATTTIYTGQTYTVTTLSSTTLAQWQAFFSALVSIPSVGQTIVATASGTLLGGATVTQTLTFVRAMGITANGGVTFGTSSSAYGSSGQVLTSNGDAAPTWSTISQIQPISASVATNALTISASALNLAFRSTTLGSGTVTTVSGTPANLVVPASTTLGTIAAVQSRLVVIAMNNAGTLELAVANIVGGTDLTETGLLTTNAIAATSSFSGSIAVTTGILTLSTTATGTFALGQAISGTGVTGGTYIISKLSGTLGVSGSTYQTNQYTAVSSTTITGVAGMGAYSTTARTSLAYRVIGYIDSTQATAGTWASSPSTIQGQGGQALADMSSLGVSQSWQDVVSSRALATTYYNTTGKPISVSVSGVSAGSGAYYLYATVNGLVISDSIGYAVNAGYYLTITFIVPVGGSYAVTTSSGTSTIGYWTELR